MPRLVLVDDAGMPSVVGGGVTEAVGAAEAWNGYAAGTVVNAQATANPTLSLGDGISTLVFNDPFKVCNGGCLAATFTGFFNGDVSGTCGSTGGDLSVVQVFDSDIIFNEDPKGPWNGWTIEGELGGCSLEFFLETVTTHEVGHLLGLGHSGEPAAVMYASVASCVNKGLDADDIAGLNRLYDCGTCDPIVEVCTGGVDEDCDTLTDSADPECPGGGGCTPVTEICDDNIDNDCDNDVDCDDSDCLGDPACPDCGGNKASCVVADDCCSFNCKGGICRGN